MKQWGALYVSLYSYEFVIWLDCFVGHSCPGGVCPESGPLSLTCRITTMLPTDDWHLAYMFSLVYFSVEVCLVDVFPHSVSTWRDPCVRVNVPLTLPPPSRENKMRGGGLNWRRSAYIIGWNSGLLDILISPYIAQFVGCHRQDTLWPYGRILF